MPDKTSALLIDSVYVVTGRGSLYNSERSEAIIADVVVVVDVVDSRCRIGEMAARITTRLGTLTLQVGASSSSES